LLECAKKNAQLTKKEWDSSTIKLLTSATDVSLTVRNAVCSKENAPPAVGVCTKLLLLQQLKSQMMKETSKNLPPRPVPNVTLLVRDVPDQESRNAKVVPRASSSETKLALPVQDVSLVKSKWTLPIPNALKTMELNAKSAKLVVTRTVIDARLLLLENVNSARKVSPDLLQVPVSSAPKVASNARTPVLA